MLLLRTWHNWLSPELRPWKCTVCSLSDQVFGRVIFCLTGSVVRHFTHKPSKLTVFNLPEAQIASMIIHIIGWSWQHF
jgi:hypothetical protein